MQTTTINLSDYIPLKSFERGSDFFDNTLKTLLDDKNVILCVGNEDVGLNWLKGLYTTLLKNNSTPERLIIETDDETLIEDIDGIVARLTLPKRYTKKDFIKFLIQYISELKSVERPMKLLFAGNSITGMILLAQEIGLIDSETTRRIANEMLLIMEIMTTTPSKQIEMINDFIEYINKLEEN